jgi:hypothetical protein
MGLLLACSTAFARPSRRCVANLVTIVAIACPVSSFVALAGQRVSNQASGRGGQTDRGDAGCRFAGFPDSQGAE